MQQGICALWRKSKSFRPACAQPGMQGGLLDTEAAARCTTVYLVDRRLDMLPALLSEDLCSLRGGQGRLHLVGWASRPSNCSQQAVLSVHALSLPFCSTPAHVRTPSLPPVLPCPASRPVRRERAVDAGCRELRGAGRVVWPHTHQVRAAESAPGRECGTVLLWHACC